MSGVGSGQNYFTNKLWDEKAGSSDQTYKYAQNNSNELMQVASFYYEMVKREITVENLVSLRR